MEEAELEALVSARRAAASRRDELAAELASIEASRQDSNADDEHDPEGSTLAYEHARVASLAARAEHELAELDAALARLGSGRRDECESCGAPIPPERRAALPSTRRCVGCATAGVRPDATAPPSAPPGRRRR